MMSKASKTPNNNVQNLLKILIGAAWIDGKVQLAEQQHIQKIAQAHGVARDPEIAPLLNGMRRITSQQCYQWIREYLGNQPTSEACQELLEAISGLIYSDGNVDTEEAKLLSKIQAVETTGDIGNIQPNDLAEKINQLYQRWVELLDRKLPT